MGPRLPAGVPGDRLSPVRASGGARAGLHRDRDPRRPRRDPQSPRAARGHAAARSRLRPPEPSAARDRSRRCARAPGRGGCPARRSPGPAGRRPGGRDRLRPHTAGSGGGSGAPGPPRLEDRRLPRRAGAGRAREGTASIPRRPGRGDGRDQCLRHGHRSGRRARRRPPRPARIDRGLLPGSRPRRTRRRARVGPPHRLALRHAAPAASPGERRARRGRPRPQVGALPGADALGGGR